VPRPDFGPDQTHADPSAAPSGRPDFGDRPAASSDDGGWAETGEKLLGATSATIGGLGKGLAQMGAPPGGVSLQEADPKGPVASWATTEDKDYPVAEKAGRVAAQYGPLVMMPALGGEGLVARAIPEFPRIARVIGAGLEGTAKGAVGGASQGDTKTGAKVGGGTAAGTAAFMALPSWAKTLTALAALEGGRDMAGGGRLPWGTWHMAHPLALMAATILGKFPGVSGALGAKAFGGGDGGQ
jgi:hypothetical protein